MSGTARVRPTRDRRSSSPSTASTFPATTSAALDWKVYAKSDRFYIKEYEEETQPQGLPRARHEQEHGVPLERHEQARSTARPLAAALAYLIQRQQDQVALVAVRRKGADVPAAAVRTRRTLRTMLPRPRRRPIRGEKTDLGVIFHEIAERLRQRSLVVIISDLFDDRRPPRPRPQSHGPPRPRRGRCSTPSIRRSSPSPTRR